MFGANPKNYFKDFDYSKNIIDYLDIDKNSYRVVLIKKQNNEKYIFAEIGCNIYKCQDLILPPISERGYLNPVLQSFKSLNNVAIFKILLISEWFVKVDDDLYIIDGNKLVNAISYLKSKYPLDILKRRYKR